MRRLSLLFLLQTFWIVHWVKIDQPQLFDWQQSIEQSCINDETIFLPTLFDASHLRFDEAVRLLPAYQRSLTPVSQLGMSTRIGWSV